MNYVGEKSSDGHLSARSHDKDFTNQQGRTFDGRDTASSSPVAIVSESLARKYWPGESAIGKRMKPRIAGSSWRIIVGVVADVRHWGADGVIEPTAYYPYTQVPESMRSLVEANMGIAVRSRLEQSGLLHSISTAIAGIDSAVPVYDVKTMQSMVADSDSLRNFDLSSWADFLSAFDEAARRVPRSQSGDIACGWFLSGDQENIAKAIRCGTWPLPKGIGLKLHSLPIPELGLKS